MSLEIKTSSKFKRDLKRIIARGYSLARMNEVISALAEKQALPPEYRDHALTGKWTGYRECHIQPDWLLIYRVEKDELILLLVRSGTHSDLFGE